MKNFFEQLFANVTDNYGYGKTEFTFNFGYYSIEVSVDESFKRIASKVSMIEPADEEANCYLFSILVDYKNENEDCVVFITNEQEAFMCTSKSFLSSSSTKEICNKVLKTKESTKNLLRSNMETFSEEGLSDKHVRILYGNTKRVLHTNLHLGLFEDFVKDTKNL